MRQTSLIGTRIGTVQYFCILLLLFARASIWLILTVSGLENQPAISKRQQTSKGKPDPSSLGTVLLNSVTVVCPC